MIDACPPSPPSLASLVSTKASKRIASRKKRGKDAQEFHRIRIPFSFLVRSINAIQFVQLGKRIDTGRVEVLG